MKHYFDEEYDKLRIKIISMGSKVEEQLSLAIEALTQENENSAQKALNSDKEIDEMEKDIDDVCITLFAKFQPIAFDLRFIASVIKINNDFERIGDHAASIAEKVLYLLPRPHLQIDFRPMTKLAKDMLHNVVEAMVNNDIKSAQKVLNKEEIMDAYQIDYYKKIVDIMKNDPRNVKRGLNLIFIVKCLERIGDLATNVAEDIIFYVKAKDIRHSQQQ